MPKQNNHCEDCRFINTTAYAGCGTAVCYEKNQTKQSVFKKAVAVRPGAIACELFEKKRNRS